MIKFYIFAEEYNYYLLRCFLRFMHQNYSKDFFFNFYIFSSIEKQHVYANNISSHRALKMGCCVAEAVQLIFLENIRHFTRH